MAKTVEKIDIKENKKLYIYLGDNTTTSEGIILQKNYVIEKEVVDQINDAEVKEKIISIEEFTKNKNKGVR